MITLITAVPGSGKTLYAIELIDKFNREGRVVYQNINSLKKELFEHPELILDAPDDWRNTPHGSIIIYDECQQPHLYPATAQRGIVHDERLTAMETHRHSGHDLIFITQSPSFVHHHIRKLVGKHIHLHRATGLKQASIYQWSVTCDSPASKAEQKIADFEFWSFPKKFYEFYESASIHTHNKFIMPKKVKFFLICFVPFALFISYQLTGVRSPPVSEKVQEEVPLKAKEEIPKKMIEITQAEIQPPLFVEKQEKKRFEEVSELGNVSGCAVSEESKKCSCYHNNGVTLKLSYEQCLLTSKSNIAKSKMTH